MFSASPLTSHHYTIRLQCALSPVTWSHTGCWRPTDWQWYDRKGVWLSHRDLVKRHFSWLPLLLVCFPPTTSHYSQIDARMGKVNESPSVIWRPSHLHWPWTFTHNIAVALLSDCNISHNVQCVRMCSVLIWQCCLLQLQNKCLPQEGRVCKVLPPLLVPTAPLTISDGSFLVNYGWHLKCFFFF